MLGILISTVAIFRKFRDTILVFGLEFPILLCNSGFRAYRRV